MVMSLVAPGDILVFGLVVNPDNDSVAELGTFVDPVLAWRS